jgi:two-component system sensor kinase
LLQELNNTLEAQVADRTAALQERATELQYSNDRLEQTAADLASAKIDLQIAKDLAE